MDIWGSIGDEHEVAINGNTLGDSNAEVQHNAIGIGLTYYIMPINIYIAGSVGRASTAVTCGGETVETDEGFGMNLVVGKEWWVSDNWRLGIAAQCFYMSVPDEGPNGETIDLDTTSLGVLFSATYN